MSNPITPYYAVTDGGNLVYVSEFNDVCPNAEFRLLHAYQGHTRYYNAGDVQVIPKYLLGRVTAVSKEVAVNLLTIKRGALKHE